MCIRDRWMTGLPIVLTVAAVLPFWGSGFANMVLLNKEQQAINRVYLDYGNAHLLLTCLLYTSPSPRD